MAFIEVVSPRKATGETAAVYRYMGEMAETKLIPNVIRIFSLKPESMRRMIRLWELSSWSGDEPRTTRELLASLVSRLNDCHYCTDAHEAMMEAAGGKASRADKLLEGEASNATPLELALTALARKAQAQPKLLSTGDLDALRALVGDSALDYALVVAGFHFVNRVADLLDVDPEGLPEGLRRFEPLRQFAGKGAALLFRKAMDLSTRPYDKSYDEALEGVAPVFERVVGRALKDDLEALRNRPTLVEAIQIMLEERESSNLDAAVLARIDRAVEDALPATAEEAEGLHARPEDPVEAFAFVGTRYAYRSSEAMINALHREGYDDRGILELAIAIAHANQWARLRRLLGGQAFLSFLVPLPASE